METLRAPKPRVEFYDVECRNVDCNALVRCRKSELTYHENSDIRDPRERPYWTMRCPHCGNHAFVNLENTAVKS